MDDLNISNILKKYKATVYDIINTKKPNYINTRIKKVFIINLEDNIIRRNYILILMKKFNINFSLVVVNRISEKIYSQVGNKQITKDELGCTLSHMWCLKEIIKNKYENAIIFEDDVIFHKNFKAMFMNIFQRDYDFLLLGACDFSFNSLNKERVIKNDDKEEVKVGKELKVGKDIYQKKELQNSTSRVKLQIEDIIHNNNTKESSNEEKEKEKEKENLSLQMNENEYKNDSESDSEIIDETSVGSEKTVAPVIPRHYFKQSSPAIDDTSKIIYKNVYKPHMNSAKVYGAHAIYYSLEGAKAMYENKTENISFFDKDYMQIFEKFQDSSFICYPNLVISDISTSNLHHAYHFFSKSEELYYLNCFDNFSFTDYNVMYLDIILKHKGVKIKENDTYESYITRLIKYQFSCAKERDIIKNRFVLDFFTINDLEKIRLNI